MILEIAEIHVVPGKEAEFESGVRQALPLFTASDGCGGVELQRVIEVPGKYRLVVEWETVEHHTVRFRGSAAFQEWRRLVGPFFARPPQVEHVERVLPAR